jgi:hypothetical protein
MADKKKPSSKRIRVNTSFAIMPQLLEDAKQLCREESAMKGENVSFSSKMEQLVQTWVDHEHKKKGK